LADEIIDAYRPKFGEENLVEGIELVPSAGGVFEVTVDEHLLFSKKALGRHAERGEVLKKLQEYLDT
jgi:selenoprotein W-related protein